MKELSLPFVGFERGYFLDIQSFFPKRRLIGHKILSGPCNLECYYCHRRGFLRRDLPLVTVDEIVARLRKQDDYNTVVLTGGEITLFHTAAIEIMRHLRGNGITTLFSTNGSFPDRVQQIVPFADVVKIDIKGHRSQYERVAGHQIYEAVMRSISVGCAKTNVEVRIIIHAFTEPRHIEPILQDIYKTTGMPGKITIEFQPVTDFLGIGVAEPSLERLMDMCANARPLSALTLLKHYGEKECIYRLSDGAWKLYLQKEIPLRFDWHDAESVTD
jgi:pyruvate-formate lyase-activating enzyme